jgi:erythromycin esterase
MPLSRRVLHAGLILLGGMAASACTDRESSWLEELADAVGDKRIVQLGENGHGVAEFYTAKTEIVRHLHELHGFDVLAVEGGVAECWVADRELTITPPYESMQRCFWDTWSGEESEALFAYLRARRETDRPLQLVGFDNLSTSQAFQEWLDSEPTDMDPALVPRLSEAESAFSRLMGGSANDTQEAMALHRTAVEGYQAATELEGMLGLIAESRLATLNFDPETLSRDTLVEMRDGLMAELLLAHVRANPDARMLVWAHNAHVSHAYSHFVGGVRRQGEIVHEQISEDIYTIGIYSGTGHAYAWFMDEDYELAEPPEDSLEGRLLSQPGDIVFADLSRKRAQGEDWVSQSVSSFEWGMHPQTIVPDQMYDGVLVVRKVSPLSRSRVDSP